ncbi:MAG: Bax inhibitor-1/YccA family protein [Candidatus Sericytochromatia bacterium]|uniref:Bax inhibitor-1/YccA family protein n=1 Tax=Candidatus Tanganyikabacteria bacterium TaxID=2961651 RepID=A0A938BME5_9BACT|nr:Bax inhibitor-1/YccA family protein [Candidatus Tanganyikabacteria bacterium]
MRSGNPALSETTFSGLPRAIDDRAMTIQGTVNKTAVLLAIVVAAASLTWQQAAMSPILMGGGALVGFGVAMVLAFKKELAPMLAPVYAGAEGIFLGGATALAENAYPGIGIQAIGLTFGILFSLLVAYKSGLIKVTENFKLGITAATGGILLFYLVSFGLSFFGIGMPIIHGSGLIGIGFSLFVVAIAAFNLVLDFDFIEAGAANQAPKFMEWYGAFGLMVTLVWLYIEILRLLMKLADRR